jgi:ABC-type bacteriocin/lantibiotic exporter with double-glycine peptidase domain
MTRPLSPVRAVLAAALLAVAALPGCVTVHPGSAREATWDELRAEEGWTLVDGVPFVPQEAEKDCGAAAVSMVLARWGVEVPAAVLERECAVPGQDGIRAGALRDAVRRRGLRAFVVPGRVEDLGHELSQGRPVVVGLVQSLGPLTASHFEVVVGLHPRDGRIAALDPSRGLVTDSLAAFESEWVKAKGTALVVFRPGGGQVARAPGIP